MAHNDTATLPEIPVDRVADARVAVLIAAAGIGTYWAFVVATRGIFGFDVGRVSPVFAGLIALNLWLALTTRDWIGRRSAAAVYGAFHAVMMTVVFHLLGGFGMDILFVTYAFPIFHAAMFRAGASVFVTANVGAACYAALPLVEGKWSPQAAGYVLCGFLVLNFLALYANYYGHQLRNLAVRLSQMVAERTRQLTVANQELRTKARALEEKQEELRAFVHTVTHDLKNPLNAILLLADLIRKREGPALGPQAREDLARIERLAGATEDMLRDLLGLFRITSAPERAAWVDLDTLVGQTLEHLGPQIAAKGVHVEVGRLPRVWGQQAKLAQVVTNLVSNAVKYVPAGRGEVAVSGGVENGEAYLAVRDNGIGIAEEYHRGIFELFGRVPEEEQRVDGEAVAGTGVGLATVKRVVEAHHGRVDLESAPGAGSRFVVRLPRETPP